VASGNDEFGYATKNNNEEEEEETREKSVGNVMTRRTRKHVVAMMVFYARSCIR
jgi:hypothetical protein